MRSQGAQMRNFNLGIKNIFEIIYFSEMGFRIVNVIFVLSEPNYLIFSYSLAAPSKHCKNHPRSRNFSFFFNIE